MTDMTIAPESTVVVVATYQVRENYGAHDWNGEGECPQGWKYKGASYKLVAEGPSWEAAVGDISTLGDRAAAMAERNNYWDESLMDYEIIFLSEARRTIVSMLEAEPEEEVGFLRYQFDNDIVWDHICGSNYLDRSPAKDTLARLQAG